MPARRVILRSKLLDVGMFGPGLSRRRKTLWRNTLKLLLDFLPVPFDVDDVDVDASHTFPMAASETWHFRQALCRGVWRSEALGGQKRIVFWNRCVSNPKQPKHEGKLTVLFQKILAIDQWSTIFNIIQLFSYAWISENVFLSGNSSTGMGTAPGIWNDILVVPWMQACESLQRKVTQSHQKKGNLQKISAFICSLKFLISLLFFSKFWKHSLFWPFAVKSCQVVKALVSLVPRNLWQQRDFSEALAYFSLPMVWVTDQFLGDRDEPSRYGSWIWIMLSLLSLLSPKT